MHGRPTVPQSNFQVFMNSLSLYLTSWARVLPFAIGTALAGSIADACRVFVAKSSAGSWLLLLQLFGFVISMLFDAALYLRQDAIGNSQAIGGELERAFGRLGWFLVTFLARFLIIAIMVAPVVFFLSFVWMRGEQVSHRWALLSLVIASASMFAFIIMLAVYMTYSDLLILVEDRRPVAAFKASWRLVKGLWWRTAVIPLIGGAIHFVLHQMISGSSPVSWLSRKLATPGTPAIALLAPLLAAILLRMVATPYFSALMLAMYYDAKLRCAQSPEALSCLPAESANALS